MKIFGLTGGIASGKSTVSSILNSELGVNVIDADILARRAVEPGSLGLQRIVQEFGEEVLLPDKSLNRIKLAEIVFHNNKSIKTLNNIVHPEVDRLYKQELEGYREQRCEAIIYDCPLLIEENLMDRVDEIIVVVTGENIQLSRLMSRNNLSRDVALQRIQVQMKMEEKVSFGKYIIYNEGDSKQLKASVIHLWRHIINT